MTTASGTDDQPASVLSASLARAQGAEPEPEAGSEPGGEPGPEPGPEPEAGSEPEPEAGGDSSAPRGPFTLAIDIGGTGLKASVLDAEGRMVADRVRVATTYPLPPDQLVEDLVRLVAPLPRYERASVGFPGVVRGGLVLTAPHFVTTHGPGSEVDPSLRAAWKRYDLTEVLAERLGAPVRLANDADLQGLAVIKGVGLELVVTLGTGVGTALFWHGALAPHLELAHHPFRKGQTYNEQLGDDALQRVGLSKWRHRLLDALDNFAVLLNFDRCYLGGGNARHAVGHVDPSIEIVDNVAGILGGIKLWETTIT